MRTVRRRLSYANVTATLALLLALSGGAVYAAEKIGSRDIAKNAVKSKHVKNNGLKGKDVKDGRLDGKDVADDGLTGADLDEATLGVVPRALDADRAAEAAEAADADLLDGLDSSAFAPFSAARSEGPTLVDDPLGGAATEATLFTVGAFTVTRRCTDIGSARAAAVILETSENGGHAAIVGNDPTSGDVIGSQAEISTSAPFFVASSGDTAIPRLSQTSFTFLPPGGTQMRTGVVFAGANMLGTDCVFGYTLFSP